MPKVQGRLLVMAIGLYKNNIKVKSILIFSYFFLICLPPGFLPVLGPTVLWFCLQHLVRPCYVALRLALICACYPELIIIVHRDRVTRLEYWETPWCKHIPCLIYWTWRNHQYGLRLETQFSRDLEMARFEPGAGSQSATLPQSYRASVVCQNVCTVGIWAR